MQSKLGSLTESITNIIVGVIIALGSQLLIFHYYQIPVSMSVNLQMTAWFTVISLVRSYVVRRVFNRINA